MATDVHALQLITTELLVASQDRTKGNAAALRSSSWLFSRGFADLPKAVSKEDQVGIYPSTLTAVVCSICVQPLRLVLPVLGLRQLLSSRIVQT